MNGDNSAKRRAKPRYKGFETFLRRMAYNLGNSPSQTEVKIISCIPIDVSDLQHRILVLEQKIAEKQKNPKNDSRSAKSPPVVNTALYCPQFQPIRTAVTAHCEDLVERDTKEIHEFSYSPNLEHSKISQICIQTPDNTMNKHDTNIENSTVTDHRMPTKTLNIIQEASANNHKKLIDLSKNSISHKNEEDKDTDDKISLVNHHPKKLPEKKRYIKKKNKFNTQLVYYTQTLNSPFSQCKTPIESVDKENKYHAMNRAYLTNMIQKQYKPKLRNSSSDFSSPICRDFDTCHHFTCSYDSDLCSCCRGKFRNIDLIPQTRNKTVNKPAISTPISTINRKNDYYNSSYYDVVPVKEKSIKNKHTQKVPKDIAGLMCYPERIRPKTRYRINQTKNLAIKNTKHRFKGNSYCSIRVKNLRSKVDAKVGFVKIRNNRSGNLITRKQITTPNIESQEPARPVVLHKNQASLTHNFNNIECQTSAHSKPTTSSYENKTEATLNQIKAILQSVLNEVKTTSQVKCASEDKPQKADAVVQKGLSQNRLQNSSQFLQSFTYSPYNITPYMNSYSPQLPSSSLCCPSLPYHHLRYLQNFPLLIQTPQTKINNCFKQPHVTRSVCTINTTNVTTNTTSEDNYDKQDEAFKLIKEIYDSIAMDMEIPTKDIPVSNHENIVNPPLNNSYPSESKVNPVITPLNSFFTKPVKDTISLDNKPISKTNNIRMSAGEVVNCPGIWQRKEEEKIQKYFVNKNMFGSRKPNNDDVTLTDPSETSDSDTEIEDAPSVSKSVMNVQIQEKKSLFSKIINSVKMFKNMEKKKKQMNNDSEESESSDNYQPTYEYIKPTYEVPKSKNYSNQIVLNRLHTTNQSPGNLKNAPNLDQEYRRRWEENLMFHNGKPQNISSYGRPSGPSRCSAVQGSRNAAVWRHFDGRSTINHRTQTIEKIKNPCNISLNVRKEDNTKTGVQRLHWLRKQNCLKLPCAPHWKKIILEG